MFTNYLLYLITLTKAERMNHIIAVFIFFMIMLVIAGILSFIKYKYEDKAKNKTFKKFLEKI